MCDGRNLDKIQAALAGLPDGILERNNPDLLVVFVNKPDFGNSDLVVNAETSLYGRKCYSVRHAYYSTREGWREGNPFVPKRREPPRSNSGNVFGKPRAGAKAPIGSPHALLRTTSKRIGAGKGAPVAFGNIVAPFSPLEI